MEKIKDWLMIHLLDFGMGIGFIVFLVFSYGIWSICKYLEDKEWNLIIKIILGIIIIIIGLYIVNITLLLGLRGDLTLFQLIKSITEGIIIPFVFFKIIPRKGKYVALFVVLLIAALAVYVGIQYGYDNNWLFIDSILRVGSSVVTYFVLLKIYRTNHDSL